MPPLAADSALLRWVPELDTELRDGVLVDNKDAPGVVSLLLPVELQDVIGKLLRKLHCSFEPVPHELLSDGQLFTGKRWMLDLSSGRVTALRSWSEARTDGEELLCFSRSLLGVRD